MPKSKSKKQNWHTLPASSYVADLCCWTHRRLWLPGVCPHIRGQPQPWTPGNLWKGGEGATDGQLSRVDRLLLGTEEDAEVDWRCNGEGPLTGRAGAADVCWVIQACQGVLHNALGFLQRPLQGGMACCHQLALQGLLPTLLSAVPHTISVTLCRF